MITLAFYTGWGGGLSGVLVDAVIRGVTMSRFSHVEVILGPATTGAAFEAYSSSPREGGVRKKTIHFKETHWLMIQVDMDPERALEVISSKMAQPYDFAGAVISPLRLRWRITGRWREFCSELAAEVLGWRRPWAYSPGRIVKRLRAG